MVRDGGFRLLGQEFWRREKECIHLWLFLAYCINDAGNATNISTQGGVRDRMTAAIQNSDNIWNVNKCKTVMVSFCECIFFFHDDFPPHTSSPTLLWCRIHVTSWNSQKNRNQRKMDCSTKGRLSCLFRNKGSCGVSQSSVNDVSSEMYKRCRSTEAQVLWRGDISWQICLGFMCWQDDRYWG